MREISCNAIISSIKEMCIQATRILTNWDHIFPCNRQIFAQLLQNLTSGR